MLDDSDPTGSSHKNRVERQAIFIPRAPLGFPGGTRLTIRLRHEGEHPGKTIGRFRFSVTRDQDPTRNVKLPTRAERVLAVPAGQRTERQLQVLNDYYRGIAPLLTPKRQRLSELLAFWKQLTSPNSLVMKELGKPRTSYVFNKGSFLYPGKEVQPGVPSVLHPLPESETPPNRLTLARWLVSPENPLVGRVTMNRLWADHFGRALVNSPENLGTQGERPTHPALLDWLATEFVEQKWSMKAMHRLNGESGAEVSELLPHLTEIVDDITIVKSLHAEQFNHAPAQLFMKTGHHLVGRPSMGSWLTYGLGSENRDLPGFVVL